MNEYKKDVGAVLIIDVGGGLKEGIFDVVSDITNKGFLKTFQAKLQRRTLHNLTAATVAASVSWREYPWCPVGSSGFYSLSVVTASL